MGACVRESVCVCVRERERAIILCVRVWVQERECVVCCRGLLSCMIAASACAIILRACVCVRERVSE